MKNKDLIELLQQFPPDWEVMVKDLKKVEFKELVKLERHNITGGRSSMDRYVGLPMTGNTVAIVAAPFD